jgi:hypothetical protein
MRLCPQCGERLKVPPRPYYLNREQWEATRAGDYYCERCPPRPGREASSGYCYWLDHEVEEAVRKAEQSAPNWVI